MNNIDKTTVELLSRNFDLEALNIDDVNFKLFKEALIQRITYLIKHDFEKLLWILYRIDVDEKAVTNILADKQNLNPAEAIANLIIQRQIKKAETRLNYKKRDEETGGDY
jgi:hypothetical protein